MVVMKRSKVQSVLQFVWLKILQEQAHPFRMDGTKRDYHVKCN
jgi:hypothetical protein